MLEELKQKPEPVRRRIALSTSVLAILLIFSVWAYGRGYFGYSNPIVVQNTEDNNNSLNSGESLSPSTASNSETPAGLKSNTPITNTKSAANTIFGVINEQFGQLRDSIAAVIVPFFTGINVYDKTGK